MKIGIISDTHGRYANISKGIDIFKKYGVEYVLHAGDIVVPNSLEMFSELEKCRFVAVFGNCDMNKICLTAAINGFGGEIFKSPHTIDIGNKKVFMTHIPRALEKVAGNGIYDLIVYGHTHKLDVRKAGQTLIVNPGNAGVVLLDMESMTHEYFQF